MTATYLGQRFWTGACENRVFPECCSIISTCGAELDVFFTIRASAASTVSTVLMASPIQSMYVSMKAS